MWNYVKHEGHNWGLLQMDDRWIQGVDTIPEEKEWGMARPVHAAFVQDFIIASRHKKFQGFHDQRKLRVLVLVSHYGWTVFSTNTVLPLPSAYLTLLLGSLQNAFFNGALTDESVDSNLLCLPQAVGPVHGLLVHSGVPIAIIKNHLCRQDKNTAKTEALSGQHQEFWQQSSHSSISTVWYQVFFYDIKMNRYLLIKPSHSSSALGKRLWVFFRVFI